MFRENLNQITSWYMLLCKYFSDLAKVVLPKHSTSHSDFPQMGMYAMLRAKYCVRH